MEADLRWKRYRDGNLERRNAERETCYGTGQGRDGVRRQETEFQYEALRDILPADEILSMAEEDQSVGMWMGYGLPEKCSSRLNHAGVMVMVLLDNISQEEKGRRLSGRREKRNARRLTLLPRRSRRGSRLRKPFFCFYKGGLLGLAGSRTRPLRLKIYASEIPDPNTSWLPAIDGAVVVEARILFIKLGLCGLYRLLPAARGDGVASLASLGLYNESPA
ncbi:hypothetical protein VTI74DRAFT_4182 [Chaetomium olivicolor]